MVRCGRLFRDLHAGISNIVLEPEAFDLGEGVTIRKTYAHLTAHFVMAFAAPPPNSFHPWPWKAAKGTASFAVDIAADLCIPSDREKRFSNRSNDCLHAETWDQPSRRCRGCRQSSIHIVKECSRR